MTFSPNLPVEEVIGLIATMVSMRRPTSVKANVVAD
jgi:hypothetical protein